METWSFRENSNHIHRIVYTMTRDLHLTTTWCQQLHSYKVVQSVADVSTGEFVRWFRTAPTLSLQRPAIVVKIDGDTGDIICKTIHRFPKYFKINFIEQAVFRKCSDEELFVMRAYDYT